MHFHLILTLLASATALCAPLSGGHAKRQSSDTSGLDAQLQLATSSVQRVALLAAGGNQSFVFDFNSANGTQPPPGGGSVVLASASSFPALIGRQSAAALFTLNPCGLVPPHIHPRADEFILVTEGTVFTQFLTETGSVLISNNLTTFSGTLFPQGSIHLEFNPTCGPAVFTAGFNSNDPGVSNVAANFLQFDEELVAANLGGDEVVSGADIAKIQANIPKDTIIAVQDCLKACGIPANHKRSLKVFGLP
jgi:oxalate decarboxylase/phosphoglucose isomerase-like protein (cupin superfamily)